MSDARNLLAVLRTPNGENFVTFAASLNVDAGESQKRLSDELGGIAGFVPADEAVEKSSDKKAVLARMEKSRRDWLPVVNKESKILEGVVDRSRLAASILLDVTKRLEGKK